MGRGTTKYENRFRDFKSYFRTTGIPKTPFDKNQLRLKNKVCFVNAFLHLFTVPQVNDFFQLGQAFGVP
jgi:hypothetical protein